MWSTWEYGKYYISCLQITGSNSKGNWSVHGYTTEPEIIICDETGRHHCKK